MYHLQPAFWYDWETESGIVTARFTVPQELMHVYERVLTTIGRDYEGYGLDRDDIRIKSMPALRNVFYQHAKEKFYGTR